MPIWLSNSPILLPHRNSHLRHCHEHITILHHLPHHFPDNTHTADSRQHLLLFNLKTAHGIICVVHCKHIFSVYFHFRCCWCYLDTTVSLPLVWYLFDQQTCKGFISQDWAMTCATVYCSVICAYCSEHNSTCLDSFEHKSPFYIVNLKWVFVVNRTNEPTFLSHKELALLNLKVQFVDKSDIVCLRYVKPLLKLFLIDDHDLFVVVGKR